MPALVKIWSAQELTPGIINLKNEASEAESERYMTENLTLQRKEELLDLISDDYTLYNNVIWFDFVESIDGNIHKFGSTDDTDGFEGAKLRARCGYLGPQGAFLIMSTIGRIFAHSFPDLRRRLSRTIDRLIKDRPQDFDSPKPTLLPVMVLPIHHFMEFVLMPHIAARLIAEDMEVSYQQAVDIKDASGDFGEMFHWDLKNTHVQSLDQNNMQAAADEFVVPLHHQIVFQQPISLP
ncbi:hypothetical protein B0H11DRAFT_2285368 [Mycena galericulata]|nr:hypothetical protein B0H11DRAFT_2285368 [Mycena galericulata]